MACEAEQQAAIASDITLTAACDVKTAAEEASEERYAELAECLEGESATSGESELERLNDILRTQRTIVKGLEALQRIERDKLLKRV